MPRPSKWLIRTKTLPAGLRDRDQRRYGAAARSMCGYHNRPPNPDNLLVLACSNGKVRFVGPFRTEEIARSWHDELRPDDDFRGASSRCRRPRYSPTGGRALPRSLTSWNDLPFATNSNVPVGA